MFFCSTTILTCLGKRNVYGEAYTVLFVVRLFGKKYIILSATRCFCNSYLDPQGQIWTTNDESVAVTSC